ncbi:MAG: hypothetical protein U9N53_00675 [Bacteroidota bacterium]|nr:hypothetical protein [Bacteroidota bacterium]
MRSNISTSLLIIFLFSIPGISLCQSGMNARMQSILKTTTLYVADAYEDVYGNPYVDEEFKEGEILFKDSSIYNGIGMRLNHNNDQIEFQQDGQILAIPNPEDLISVSFGDYQFIYGEYTKGKKVLSSFFEVLVSGKADLLYRRESIVKREQLPPSEMSGKNYRDYFRTIEDYYIKREGGPASLVYKTQKSLLKALTDKKFELEKYIDQNNLKIKKEEDLKVLVEYYNSIQ